MKQRAIHHPTISFIVHGYLPFDRAGVPIYVDKLSRKLASSNCFSVRNLASSKHGRFQKKFAACYQVEYLPVYSSIRELVRSSVFFTIAILIYGVRYVREWRTDLIHGHTTFYGGIQALLLGFLTRRPVILTLHGFDRQWIFLKLLFNAKRIIVQRRALVRKLESNGFDRKRIVLIPNCIEVGEEPPINTREGTRKVVFVGRMDSFKRPDLFIDAVKQLSENSVKIQTLLRGAGPLLESLKKLATDNCSINENIKFEGVVKRPFADLGYGDIFIACSDIENYSSTSLLEAMERGMAVIATDVGETREIIEDGINGILVKPTKDDIAKAILTLVRNIDQCITYGKQARNRIIKDYSYNKLLKMHIDTYESILFQRSG